MGSVHGKNGTGEKKGKKKQIRKSQPQPQPQQQQQQQQQQPQPQPQPQQQQQSLLRRAMHDYDGQAEGDLIFHRGDVIQVLAGANEQWLLGQIVGTDRRGYVPSNFLADLQSDDPKLLPGYYNCSRADAEKELVRAAHQAGAFIIRPCAACTDALALSVKYRHLDEFKIFHYKLKRDPNGVLVYITGSKKFPTVASLLDFYTKEQGLVCKLTGPADTSTKPVVPFRDLVIDQQKVKCIAKLGSGSFGVVFRGTLLNKIDVAVKQLKMESTINTEDSLINEAKTQYRLSHRNIVQFIGYTQTSSGEFWIIMEFAEKGSLHSHLSKPLEFKQQIDYIRQVSNGMAYLEKEQVVHRDLRAANLLLTSKDVVKIADFGLARAIEKSDTLYTIEVGVYSGGENCKFPIRWTAPEGINRHEFSVKSDVWSFGVCAYEIVSGATKPYLGKSNQEVIDKVNTGGRLANPLAGKFEREDPRSKQAQFLYEEVMLLCWRMNPDERPTFYSLSTMFEDFENAVNNRYAMYD